MIQKLSLQDWIYHHILLQKYTKSDSKSDFECFDVWYKTTNTIQKGEILYHESTERT